MWLPCTAFLECHLAAIMNYSAPVPKFTAGDLVNFRGSTTCVVVSSWDQLGFNRYKLLDLDNGREIQASTHDLREIPVASVDTEMDFSENNGPAPSDVNTPAPEEASGGSARFQQRTEQEIDYLASQRTEKNTDKQTSWAVRIFKGKLMATNFHMVDAR